MPQELKGYDVAQVCPNGHVANATTIRFPEDNKDHCDKCGEKTITACPRCQKTIQGFNWGGGATTGEYNLPAFCKHCGAAFPWTESKMQAAIDLFLDELAVSEEEKREFEQSIQAVTKDTPAAQVASNRISRSLKKVGEGAKTMILAILKDIASEAAKKTLFPN
jgi:hypothetical protein